MNQHQKMLIEKRGQKIITGNMNFGTSYKSILKNMLNIRMFNWNDTAYV